eukprot:2821514-Pleurochrysis_carterae.AAC.1
MAEFTAALVTAAEAVGTPWALENPADCGDPRGLAWWPRFAEHAPLWLLPIMQEALGRAGAEYVTFAQCALGAATRKYTTVACAASLRPRLRQLAES